MAFSDRGWTTKSKSLLQGADQGHEHEREVYIHCAYMACVVVVVVAYRHTVSNRDGIKGGTRTVAEKIPNDKRIERPRKAGDAARHKIRGNTSQVFIPAHCHPQSRETHTHTHTHTHPHALRERAGNRKKKKNTDTRTKGNDSVRFCSVLLGQTHSRPLFFFFFFIAFFFFRKHTCPRHLHNEEKQTSVMATTPYKLQVFLPPEIGRDHPPALVRPNKIKTLKPIYLKIEANRSN